MNSNETIQPAERFFVFSIDVEGDNVWSRPEKDTTENSRYLPRFQQLCERFCVRPTYLVNFEMARCLTFQEFARDVIDRGVGEIGMHLHAWTTPPAHQLTSNDRYYHPYLTEYPDDILREKVEYQTKLLQDTFGVPIVSHRAGRFGFNSLYANTLVELGYKVDCSVTPHLTWHECLGDPEAQGGPDYRDFPEDPYFLSPSSIRDSGNLPLLEVPVTVVRKRIPALAPLEQHIDSRHLLYRVFDRLFNLRTFLYPHRRNLAPLLSAIRSHHLSEAPVLQMCIHSSELMPGGSPSFPSEKRINYLYQVLERVFALTKRNYRAVTLCELYQAYNTLR